MDTTFTGRSSSPTSTGARGDYAALLLRRELGEHGKRKHLGGCLLGDREVTRTEAQRLIRLREVKRDRVVDARSNACGGEVLLEPLPILDPHHIEVEDRSRPERHVWQNDRRLGVGEELVVPARPLPPLLVP